MRAALALPALLVLASLAGCFGKDEPVAASDAAPVADAKPDPAKLALPDNRSGSFNAFKETNVTSGDFHNHDYWLGRTRVTILEQERTFTWSSAQAQGPVFNTFRVPPPNLVYEGTARVEVLVSNPRIFTPSEKPASPRPPEATLFYRHAATPANEWETFGAVTWDQPMVIEVKKPEWTDMPHSSGSLWMFRIEAPVTDWLSYYALKVDIVRAEGEIPPWPGHPEFYTKSHYRLVFDGTAVTDENPARDLTGAESVVTQMAPSKLVSYGTKSLLVFVNVTSVDSPVAPTHWLLEFHNATWNGRWNGTDPWAPENAADKKSYAWTLHVDPNGMDSPYAPDSRWEFRLRGAWSTPTAATPVGAVPAFSFIGGWAPYKVTYTMTVIATDLEPAAYSAT